MHPQIWGEGHKRKKSKLSNMEYLLMFHKANDGKKLSSSELYKRTCRQPYAELFKNSIMFYQETDEKVHKGN